MMGRFNDIDPSDIDPETGRPYEGYSSPSLDTSFHDHEMDVGDEDTAESLLREAIGDAGRSMDPDLYNRAQRFLGKS